MGHFSIDDQLKRDHYTEWHHNMFVVSGREELMEKIVLLFSFSGQTVLQLITDEHESGNHNMQLLYTHGYCKTLFVIKFSINNNHASVRPQ